MFHEKLDGETTQSLPSGTMVDEPAERGDNEGEPRAGVAGEMPDPRTVGFLLGLVVGEGHFGGDGRQPQITLRMHSRHESLFTWLQRAFPGGRLYGPYHHGGRSYYQWMARGAYLREVIAPMVAANIDLLDDPARARFADMVARYRIPLPRPGAG